MEYEIKRTSAWEAEPCDGAYRRACVRVDHRTFKTPREYENRLHEKWAAEGRNHRQCENGIARDYDDTRWFIEIHDLLEFCRKYGELVVGIDETLNPPTPCVEIYDSYRE